MEGRRIVRAGCFNAAFVFSAHEDRTKRGWPNTGTEDDDDRFLGPLPVSGVV